MQIVIKISNYDYEWIKNSYSIPDAFKIAIAEKIIYGIPLPKGHGDLIDIKDLLDQICLDDTEENRENNVGEIITLEDLDCIAIIIPTDKEK